MAMKYSSEYFQNNVFTDVPQGLPKLQGLVKVQSLLGYTFLGGNMDFKIMVSTRWKLL